jgi:acylphosphatase
MSETAYHIIVKGKVQGVFYRKSTYKKALELGLRGWVKNMDNGNVEIEAEGLVEALEKLISWCAEGPKNAIVSEVDSEEITPKGHKDFRII